MVCRLFLLQSLQLKQTATMKRLLTNIFIRLVNICWEFFEIFYGCFQFYSAYLWIFLCLVSLIPCAHFLCRSTCYFSSIFEEFRMIIFISHKYLANYICVRRTITAIHLLYKKKCSIWKWVAVAVAVAAFVDIHSASTSTTEIHFIAYFNRPLFLHD